MAFAGDAAKTIATQVALAGLGLVTGIINARFLGPELLGVLVLLLLLKNFSFRFSNLGIGSSFAYFIAKKTIDLYTSLKICICLCLIIAFLLFITILSAYDVSFSPWKDIEVNYIYIMLAFIPLSIYNNFIRRSLSGDLLIGVINKSHILYGTTLIIMQCLLLVRLDYGLAGALLCYLVSEYVLFLYLSVEVVRRREFVKKAETVDLKDIIKRMWSYGKYNYFLMLSNFVAEEIPVLTLKAFTGSNAFIGFFSKARSLGQLAYFFTIPVSQVLFPYTASSPKEEATRRTNMLGRTSLVIMTIVVACLLTAAKSIVTLLYGASFLPAVDIFYVLAPGVVVWPIGHFLEVHVAASGKPQTSLLASLATLVVTIALCITLIPAYGVHGVGLCVSLAYLTRFLSRLCAYTKVTKATLRDTLLPRKEDAYIFKDMMISVYSRLVRSRSTDYKGAM